MYSTAPWLSMEADSGGTLPDVGSPDWVACVWAPAVYQARAKTISLQAYIAVLTTIKQCVQRYHGVQRGGDCGCEGVQG